MGIPILQEIWDGVRSFFDWFIHTAPKPLRIGLFLFLLVFVIPNVVNIVLKVPFACVEAPICNDPMNDTNNSYYITNRFKDAGLTDFDLEIKGEEYLATLKTYSCEWIDNESLKSEFNPIGDFAIMLTRWLGIAKQSHRIDLYYNCTNSTGGLDERSMTLAHFYQISYIPESCDQRTDIIINPACHGEKPYLRFYNSDVDIFDYRIWFLIAVIMSLIPFALQWYQVVLNK